MFLGGLLSDRFLSNLTEDSWRGIPKGRTVGGGLGPGWGGGGGAGVWFFWGGFGVGGVCGRLQLPVRNTSVESRETPRQHSAWRFPGSFSPPHEFALALLAPTLLQSQCLILIK